jgi:CheY-like chemotaxis protein
MRAKQAGSVILVLERDQEMRESIAALLSANGFRVIAAKGEEEAVLRTQTECPQLILASVSRSPDETVAEAKHTRQRIHCNEEIPIVIFSDNTLPEGSERELAQKIYLTNPDNFNQIRELLRRVMPA